MSTATFESDLTEDGLWKNPWGFTAEDKPPEKDEYFPPMTASPETVWACCLGIEDFLQHNGVFVNGIKGTPCHMDSYMTVVDFARLDKCIALLVEHYEPSKEQWKRLTDHWLTNYNSQPPARIVGIEICHKFGVEIGKVDKSRWNL